MKRMILLILCLVILVLVAGEISVRAQSGPPLVPADLKITPPSVDLPEKLKKCLGGYSGRVEPFNFSRVGKGVNVTIFVTRIKSPEEAEVLLCWGDNPWGKKDNEDARAEISGLGKGNSVHFSFLRKDGRRTCELIIYDDGRVVMYWRNTGFVMQGDLKRIQ